MRWDLIDPFSLLPFRKITLQGRLREIGEVFKIILMVVLSLLGPLVVFGSLMLIAGAMGVWAFRTLAL